MKRSDHKKLGGATGLTRRGASHKPSQPTLHTTRPPLFYHREIEHVRIFRRVGKVQDTSLVWNMDTDCVVGILWYFSIQTPILKISTKEPRTCILSQIVYFDHSRTLEIDRSRESRIILVPVPPTLLLLAYLVLRVRLERQIERTTTCKCAI